MNGIVQNKIKRERERAPENFLIHRSTESMREKKENMNKKSNKTKT